VRPVLAIVLGMAAWAVPWNLGTRAGQAAFPTLLVPERPITHASVLVALVVYSVVLSLLAGYATATVARGEARAAVAVLAAIQLLVGIWAEVSYWELMPAWYHLVFLALVVPATLVGGALRRRCETRPAAPAPPSPGGPEGP
jgi:hypothetical protein